MQVKSATITLSISNMLLYCLTVAMVFTHMVACKTDPKESEFTLRIRIREDVDCLHPIVSQSTLATQIEALVMLPMIEFSPDSLELSPLLVENVPEVSQTTDSSIWYRTTIRKEAQWDDGKSIQANDYVFTVKASLNPYLKNPSWRSFLKNIQTIQVDSSNPREINVEVSRNYMLGKEASGNVNLYPEHIYDPERIMQTFSLSDLVHRDSSHWSVQEHERLKRFADQFESATYCKNGIQGAGPYRLKSWESGSKIVLERKQNWWGKNFEHLSPMLQSKPNTIEYLVMPDEAASILAVKEGSVDLMTDISPKQYSDLRKDSVNNPQLKFLTASHFQYSILELNLRNPILSEWPVRKALAHLADVETYIRDLMQGLADPVTGPVLQSKPYYNRNLEPVKFDPVKSKELLMQNGWSDSDSDGWLDKVIGGKKMKLSLRFLVSGAVSKNIAILMKEEARKIGIEIIPETKEASLLRNDINSRNFDILSATITQQVTSFYDPYQSYHSSASKPGGGNRSGLQSPLVDSLIIGIRTAQQNDLRHQYYLDFQKAIYELQPQIYLFSPNERLLVNSRIVMNTIHRRPGYLENTIRLK